jgi:site-specific recombinase XerD
MNATINVVCYRSKTLTNGEHPLMIRLCKDKKLKYVSLGISVLLQHWDFKKNTPKRNCPNKELIQKIINENINKYSEQLLTLKASNKDFIINNLIENLNSVSVKKYTVLELLDIHINQLIQEDRLKYASTFKELKRSLLDFNKHLNIYFSEIDVKWLKEYEMWLRKKNMGDNSIGIRFRTFRVLYNIAIDKGIVKSEHYPFKTYKVSKLHKETIKRAIPKESIKAIINYKTEDKSTQLSVDIFSFSYFCGGINFKDIAYLTKENLIDNKLVYFRRKTKKLIKVPIKDVAMDIIKKYENPNSIYLFPIFTEYHKTEIQRENRLHKILSTTNIRLRKIGKELNLPITLTTYVARHSFATVLKKAGISTSIISETLGHSSEKITQIYLDSFDNEQIDKAMDNLL